MKRIANPFKDTDPEWQLFENFLNAQHLTAVYDVDAQRYQRMAAEQRLRAEKHYDALTKLAPDIMRDIPQ